MDTLNTPFHMDYADFVAAVPAAAKGLSTIGAAAVDGGLEKDLVELVKLRASQLNGCAYCLQYHLNVGRKLGIPQVKFDLLAAWRDAGIYSAREKAALAWTEALTLIAGHEVSEALSSEVAKEFPGLQMALLTSAVATINAWNRIAGPLRFKPPISAG